MYNSKRNASGEDKNKPRQKGQTHFGFLQQNN